MLARLALLSTACRWSAPRHGEPRLCAAPLSPEEWRSFRAALVAAEEDTAGSPTPENENRLRHENKQLYDELQRGGNVRRTLQSAPRPGML